MSVLWSLLSASSISPGDWVLIAIIPSLGHFYPQTSIPHLSTRSHRRFDIPYFSFNRLSVLYPSISLSPPQILPHFSHSAVISTHPQLPIKKAAGSRHTSPAKHTQRWRRKEIMA